MCHIPGMRRSDICLYLGPADRAELEALATNRNTPHKLVWRAESAVGGAKVKADVGTSHPPIMPRRSSVGILCQAGNTRAHSSTLKSWSCKGDRCTGPSLIALDPPGNCEPKMLKGY